MNVLLITLDQFRGDSWGAAGHPLVTTPNLDRLAAEGVRLACHHSQAAPCAPGRASLYTGMYQANHRVVGNGSPLDDRFDNVARLARRAGYAPALFGYTDQALDPRMATGPDDPRLATYEGVLPGFDCVLDLAADMAPWRRWLEARGHDAGGEIHTLLRREPSRPEAHSQSAFLTEELVSWIRRQDAPWFAHASYLRPHPPYAAAGRWATAYDPADVPLPVPPPEESARHALHRLALQTPGAAAPTDEAAMRRLRAQYYGMIGEVDDQLGRLWAALEELGQWDDTLVIVTADHADLLGDQGLVGKLGWWDASFHVLGVVRGPGVRRGHVVEHLTENVDLVPTIAEAIGEPVPRQCDGRPLGALLRGDAPTDWRRATHWEWDWRSMLGTGASRWPTDRHAERSNLAVTRTTDAAYAQFGNGSYLAFDLAADPTWHTPLTDPEQLFALARTQLGWRAEHLERTFTDVVLGVDV